MRQGLGQQQGQSTEPSQLTHGPPSFVRTSKDHVTTTQCPEEAERPCYSEGDYPTSTENFPGPIDCADETHPSQQDLVRGGLLNGNVEDSHGKTRKRMRRRQTGAVKQKKRAAAIRRANAPRSKASIKRAELIATYGAHMIGSDEGLKGETRTRADGFVDWKDPGTGKWLPAAPHDWFRLDFINLDKADAPYLELPARGIHPLDITSNCSALGQNLWSFDPQGCEDIVDSEDNKVMFLDKAPIRFHEYPLGEYWRYNGLIMLDPDDRPVLNWTSIPMVFSSKLEGGRMEALKRVFPWLKSADLRARMPRMVQNAQGTFSSLHKYSTFGQRLSRFRDRTGCSAWIERGGTADRWRHKSHTLFENTDGGEDVVPDGSDSESAGQGNGSIMKNYAVNGFAMRPRKKPRISDTPVAGIGLQGMQYFPSSQENQAIGPSAEQMAQISPTPPWQYNGWVDPPLEVFDQSGFPRYSQPPEFCSIDVPSNEVDLRFAKPQTTADDQNIKTALHVTRADFRSRYHFDAPNTPNGESYFTQYQIIQAKHNELWVVDDNPPPLISIANWYGSFQTWPIPHLLQEELQRLAVLSETPQT